MVAWTVGNPEAYEAALDNDGPVTKQPGGGVFLRRADADEAVADGFLPDVWGLGHLPGRVYGVEIPSNLHVAIRPGPPDEVGAYRLAVSAPIFRVWN